MPDDLPYLVEQWSADDAEVARAAFARAVRVTGDAPITRPNASAVWRT